MYIYREKCKVGKLGEERIKREKGQEEDKEQREMGKRGTGREKGWRE